MSACHLAALVALVCLGSAGCGAVKVKSAGAGLKLAPKPKDCEIAFLRKAPPAFEEIADLEAHVTSAPPGGALEVLRPKACELGADAIIVTRNFETNEFGHTLVAGTAIKLEAPPAPPPVEAPRSPPASAVDL